MVRDIIYGWARGFVNPVASAFFKPQTFTQDVPRGRWGSWGRGSLLREKNAGNVPKGAGKLGQHARFFGMLGDFLGKKSWILVIWNLKGETREENDAKEGWKFGTHSIQWFRRLCSAVRNGDLFFNQKTDKSIGEPKTAARTQ